MSGEGVLWHARRRAEMAGIRALVGAARLIGVRRMAGVADWTGRTLGPLLPTRRRVDDNLELIRPGLSEAERRRILKGAAGNLARIGAEYLDIKGFCARAPRWRIEGLEHLQAAQAANGGRIVFASAHLGHWEAVRAMAARHGAPTAIIYHRFENPYFDAYALRVMSVAGWPAFHKGRKGGRQLYRHVAKGGAALILVDQRQGGAPLVDFMGRPAETSFAAAQLSLAAKAPLVPVVAFRAPAGEEFRVRFEPAIPPSQPETMMAELNARVGAWVDEAPEQWFWFHRRWRVRPLKHRHRKGSAAEIEA